jgi:hypothetical protein
MAKKMLLIDPRLLETITQKQHVPPDAVSDSLHALDKEMEQVLERTDLALNDKAKLYQQTLRRYLNRLDYHRNKPLGLVDFNPPPALPTPPKSEFREPEISAATEEPTVLKIGEVDKPRQLSPKVPEKSASGAARATSRSSLRRGNRNKKNPKWEKWG